MFLKNLAQAAITVAMATAAAVGLSVSPAVADGDTSGRAYVHVDEEWADEGDLSISRHAYSNATCLWQKILWADNYLNEADIDGIFGDRTAAATKRWKDAHGLNDDGTAGVRAWRTAGSRLRSLGGRQWVFLGYLRHFTINTDENGRFGFYDDGVHRLAGYNYHTCS